MFGKFGSKVGKTQNSGQEVFKKKTYQKQPQNQKQESKKDSIQNRIKDNLKGSKFRLINEFLYTENSNYSFKHFQQNKQDFDTYHDGFQQQVKSWNVSPVHMIAKMISENKDLENKTLVDLGCGRGELYEELKEKEDRGEGIKLKKIMSYDLVSVKEFISVADITQLPLENESVECGVLCLALMGTNYIDFLLEATRVLTLNAHLYIAEVTSRFPNFQIFLQMMNYLGYTLINQIDPNQYFVICQFQKNKHKKLDKNKPFESNSAILRSCNEKAKKINKKQQKKTIFQLKNLNQLSQYILKPCIYKKR